MELNFSLDDAQLRSVFTNFERPTRPLMTAIANFLADEARNAIKTQTSPDGSKFAALNPKYAARKAKDKKTKRNGILQQSGQLFDTIAAEATNDTAIVKTNRPVGSYDLGSIHQFGAPRRNIPARPFFPITDDGDLLPDAVEEIQSLAANYFSL
jgi:phage virion morphogenesis protein